MADVEGLDVDVEGPGRADDDDFGLLSGLDLESGFAAFLGGMMGSWVRCPPGNDKPNGALELRFRRCRQSCVSFSHLKEKSACVT